MLETFQSGDTLIVRTLDHLGFSVRDVEKTLATLAAREVHVYAIRSELGRFDFDPTLCRAMLQLFAMRGRTEKVLRSERFTELARQRKEQGLAYGGVPTAKKIVVRGGVKHLQWDFDELAIIAEIARRLPREGAAAVAKDLWRRRIKDRRGCLWGQQVPKTERRAQKLNRALRWLLGRHRNPSPYQHFYRAVRWFHRMKWKGLLPPPYDLGQSIEEPKGFGEEPKSRGWTPGGTARRERKRAEAKARHRVERREQWRKEEEARMAARVHKPMLVKEGMAATLNPSAGQADLP
jgi:hypothetical protein